MKEELLIKWISHKGQFTQVLKAIEEMSELTKELSKYLAQDPGANSSHIQEEIADVTLMMEQMRLCFFPVMVDRWKEKKEENIRQALMAVEHVH